MIGKPRQCPGLLSGDVCEVVRSHNGEKTNLSQIQTKIFHFWVAFVETLLIGAIVKVSAFFFLKPAFTGVLGSIKAGSKYNKNID